MCLLGAPVMRVCGCTSTWTFTNFDSLIMRLQFGEGWLCIHGKCIVLGINKWTYKYLYNIALIGIRAKCIQYTDTFQECGQTGQPLLTNLPFVIDIHTYTHFCTKHPSKEPLEHQAFLQQPVYLYGTVCPKFI